MIIPIRCWSCGKPIAHLWEEFKQKTDKGEPVKKALDDLGVERYCCRQQFMGNLELADVAASFKKF